MTSCEKLGRLVTDRARIQLGAEKSSVEHVAFLLIPQFSMMSFTSSLEPLRLANLISQKPLYHWLVCTTDGEAALASNGVELASEGSLRWIAEARRLQKLIVCAGVDAETFEDEQTFATLRLLARKGVKIGAISNGSFVLARAGLLDHRRCTIHWESRDSFAETFPTVDVSGSLFEIDGECFTSCGGTAALDMMLHFIGQQHGEALATAIGDQFILERIREQHDPQRMPVVTRLGLNHPKMVQVVNLMEENLETPLDLTAIARRVSLSRRQLERLFKMYLSSTPSRYYLKLRLQRARLLLRQSTMSITNISVACGFVSAPHFSKVYAEMHGVPPKADRRSRICLQRLDA